MQIDFSEMGRASAQSVKLSFLTLILPSALGAFSPFNARASMWMFMLLYFFSPAEGQLLNPRFEHLTVEDGLTNSFVTSIVQDQQGFIWIGTLDGLCKYDGYQFTTYRSDENRRQSLSDNFITTLLVTQDGTLWVGTMNGGLNRFDPTSGQFDHFQFDPEKEYSLSNNTVYALYEDRSQNLWVGTRRGGLSRLDRTNEKFQRYQHDPADPNSISDNFIRSVTEDHHGFLWVGTNGGLNKLDPRSGKFSSFREGDSPDELSQDWVFAVKEDKEGMIWAGTINGLNRLNPETGQFRQFWPEDYEPDHPFALSSHRITCFLLDLEQNLWIGTETGGINQYDYSNERFYPAQFSPDHPHSIINNEVHALCQDREGSIWIGTAAGISVLKPSLRAFELHNHVRNDPNSLTNNNINSLFEGKGGHLWIGTQDGGLNQFNPQEYIFENYLTTEGRLSLLGGNIINSIYEEENGQLWVGTYGSGLIRYNRSTGEVFRYRHSPSNRNFIFSIHIDRQGVLWFGSAGGLNRLKPGTTKADYFPYAPEDPTSRMTSSVTCVKEDVLGRLWIGTSGYGFKQFNRTTESFTHYRHAPEDPHSLSHNNITAILEDQNGRIWIATKGGGLNEFLTSEGIFVRYREKDGLPSDVISDIVADMKGRLWISTGKGLSRFDPAAGSFRNYDIRDGLPSYELRKLHYSPTTGRIYLASDKGLIIFHPDQIVDNLQPPPVVFTKMTRHNTALSEGLPIEEKAIGQKKSITLSHRDDILTFEFAALSYLKSKKNQYAYLLKGFSENWIPLGTKRDVSFTNLDPGDYTLQVKASNGDGIWNETGAALKIIILPPWYWNGWAKVCYLFILSGAVVALYRFQITRKLAAAEAQRLRELDEVKTKLYTNITHEFRTPLTIISGMADQVQEDPQNWFREGLQMIKRNSNRLLNLVNQMLELRKLEAGTLPVNMIQSDIISYLRYLGESFHSLAESKNIRLEFAADLPELKMDFDPDKITVIVSNLLSNAIKFTPGGGTVLLGVSITSDHHSLRLWVTDSGIGIPASKLPHIFDRFYQVDNASTRKAEGTGIGLALTRELVKLLSGEISVDSREGRGTSFTVMLPVTRNASKAEVIIPEAISLPIEKKNKSGQPLSASLTTENPAKKAGSDTDLPLLLLIEDNQDVVQYLKACIGKDYRTEVAYNGQQGVEKALKEVPDLIISDVMMPKMNGFEVCQTLKKDTRTSHIPVILLTAKADLDSRLEGLERGADVYLAKPFEKEELLVRIRKLLELRNQLQQHYLALAGIREEWLTDYPTVEKEEQEFLNQIRSLIEYNLTDPDYSVPRLCKEAGMSKSQLHRKLTALTGLSANRFLRSIRLAKGKTLLENSDLPISDIAYETGFRDPDYFTRLFRDSFGVSPREFRKEG